MEYAATFGLPNWQDGLRPCWGCNADLDTCYDGLGNHRINDEDDSYDACSRCGTSMTIADPAMHMHVWALLIYDKRKDGSKGRCLTQDIPAMGLVAGMRLEACDGLRDIGDVDNISVSPVTVQFWDLLKETLARHRNPIFDPLLGLAPQRCLTIDTLHCLYLGVFNVFSRWVLGALIAACVSGNSPGTADEQLVLHNLHMWYRRRHQLRPQEKLTEINDLIV